MHLAYETGVVTNPLAKPRAAMGGAMIIISRLKLNADAGVGEEVGGVVAEAPADADANFEVGRHQIVEAGADV
mgnify:CR=1 FL=1